MTSTDTKSFQVKLLKPARPGDDDSWAFVILPKEASDSLPRRGRTTVAGALNGHGFQETLEPDGQLSHWLRVSRELREAAGVEVGDTVTLEIRPVDKEPEPEVPPDLAEALAASPEARQVWEGTTTIARLDWIHWVVSAKQAKTRAKRIRDACDQLAEGKKRVCCFDPSGFYSKALRAPEAAE
ncbi:YdeI/OmpD-associated family protein [Marinobacter sp. OP 3.4]|uniref:YdeI/OmpD-associated family protein n=1 Tax=Marinobacter sp. OP 3.4 TaxID=3076501 RepID=UPI002E245CA9